MSPILGITYLVLMIDFLVKLGTLLLQSGGSSSIILNHQVQRLVCSKVPNHSLITQSEGLQEASSFAWHLETQEEIIF